MQYRLIIFAILLSIISHLGIMVFFGKFHVSLPSFDVTETYIFQKTKKTEKASLTKEPITNKEVVKEEIKEEKTEEETSKRESNNEEISNLSLKTAEDSLEKEKKHNSKQESNLFTRFISEQMKFDIYWMGIYAGYAFVRVKGDEENIVISSEVHSSPFISNFYYVNDKAESTLHKGQPRHFRIIQIEGKYRGDKEVKFDYELGEIVFINHIKKKMSIHKGVDKIFMDVLSGFFLLRTFSMDTNKSLFIDIFDSDKFANVEIKILKEETVETSSGKEINALLIKPELATEGLFKRKGDIFIWLSNDERKLPLKIETKVSVGKIRAELKEYKKD